MVHLTSSPIEIQTNAQAGASIIWLHGLGADGHDFEFIVPLLKLDDLNVRFVFPHSPRRPVTINGGMTMRAWYDMRMTPTGIEQDAAHLYESCTTVSELIDTERARGIASERVVLAGFSQGGAVALHTGLRYPLPLAGVLAMSAPVPQVDTLLRECQPANAPLPVFMAHGVQDAVVPYAYAESNFRQLRAHGVNAEWHGYPMAHQVVPAEIDDIGAWLRRMLT